MRDINSVNLRSKTLLESMSSGRENYGQFWRQALRINHNLHPRRNCLLNDTVGDQVKTASCAFLVFK